MNERSGGGGGGGRSKAGAGACVLAIGFVVLFPLINIECEALKATATVVLDCKHGEKIVGGVGGGANLGSTGNSLGGVGGGSKVGVAPNLGGGGRLLAK